MHGQGISPPQTSDAFAAYISGQGHRGIDDVECSRRIHLLARQEASDTVLHGGTQEHVGEAGRQILARDLSAEDAVDSIMSETSRLDVGLLIAAAGFGTSGRSTIEDWRVSPVHEASLSPTGLQKNPVTGKAHP